MICDHQSSFKTPEHANVMWKTLPDVASVAKGHASYLDEGFSTPFLIGYTVVNTSIGTKAGRRSSSRDCCRSTASPTKNWWTRSRKIIGVYTNDFKSRPAETNRCHWIQFRFNLTYEDP